MFRTEVLNKSPAKLPGEVNIAVPISWAAISCLFLGTLIVAILFLSFAKYARVETVTGTILPDKGVSNIYPSQPGVLTELVVSEGDRVETGDLLAMVRTEQDSGDRLSSGDQIEQAITQQDSNLALQIAATNAAAAAQRSQLSAQQAGYRAEIEQIRTQIGLQEDLVRKARKDLDRALEIAERGFVSGRDLQVREEALLSRQQGLSQLNQSLAARRAALLEAERSTAQIAAQARANEANLAVARAQVGQQAATAASARSYAIRAPIAGTVTALTVRAGQATGPQQPIMAILPAGAELQAELTAPSTAIGFIKVGQEVSLAIDAFPYHRFGTAQGDVITVAESALSQSNANGEMISVYPVRVKLDTDAITAFGRRERLVSGMTLSARIVTENQSLVEWLFEPLYAVQRR